METLPQRQTLTSQTVAILKSEIARGAWADRLPSERKLCDTLQISRNTLRAALAHLQQEHVLVAVRGVGYRVKLPPVKTRGDASAPARLRDVALLTSEPLEQLRANQSLWIDELRAMLGEHDARLHVFQGAAYFRSNPGSALRELVDQHPHSCWILLRSRSSTQQWFSQNKIPCVVAGSVVDGVQLPFRDIDYRAVGRHAAGMLFALGHRRIVLLASSPSRPGDVEGEMGWLQAAKESSHPNSEAMVVSHDGSVAGIGRCLRRLLQRKSPPTAFMVSNPYHYLATTSQLAKLGMRVPKDISVISRDDDMFLSYLVPAPARYVMNSKVMSKAMLRPVLELLSGQCVVEPALKLMPEFIRGESIATLLQKYRS